MSKAAARTEPRIWPRADPGAGPRPGQRAAAVRASLRLSPPRRERLRRLRPLLALSLVLHLTVVALLIVKVVGAAEPIVPPEPTQPADYAMVFKSQQGPQSVPEKVKQGPPKAPPSTPLTAPPPLSAPPPPSAPSPAQPSAPPANPAPPQPQEERPPAPPALVPPKPTEKPPPPAVQAPSPDQLRPPPPPESRKQAARPAPSPPPRPSPSSRPSPDFPMPLDFSLGPKPQRRPPERPGASTQQAYGPQPSFNAPVGEDKSGPSFLYDYKQISGPPLGQDWFEKLLSYWLIHRYYPPQAVVNREDGTAEIRIHVDPYGHVKETELEGRSGSQSLDGAAQSWIRDAHLQPFPPGSLGEDAVIDIRIQYILIYSSR